MNRICDFVLWLVIMSEQKIKFGYIIKESTVFFLTQQMLYCTEYNVKTSVKI